MYIFYQAKRKFGSKHAPNIAVLPGGRVYVLYEDGSMRTVDNQDSRGDVILISSYGVKAFSVTRYNPDDPYNFHGLPFDSSTLYKGRGWSDKIIKNTRKENLQVNTTGIFVTYWDMLIIIIVILIMAYMIKKDSKEV